MNEVKNEIKMPLMKEEPNWVNEFNNVSLWQTCPHCQGVGKEPTQSFRYLVPYTKFDCTVCNGMKIISTLTGKPPIQ